MGAWIEWRGKLCYVYVEGEDGGKGTYIACKRDQAKAKRLLAQIQKRIAAQKERKSEEKINSLYKEGK